MNEPTQEQRKEFWEGCGVFPNCDLELDLNNLFRWAVPKVIDKIMAEQECSSDIAYGILFKKWLQNLEVDIPNHEGSLFKTIQEVLESH